MARSPNDVFDPDQTGQISLAGARDIALKADRMALLNALMISSLLAGRINTIGGIADAFSSADDIDGATSTNESYDAANDLYRPTATAASDQVPVMTAATTSGVTVTSGAVFAGGFEPWRAFDDNDATSWAPSGALPNTIKVDFGSATDVASYSLTVGGNSNQYPTSFTLEGSDNNSTWTVLDTQSSLSWSADEKKTFSLSQTESYRYFRLNVSNTGNGGSTAFDEMELLSPLAYQNMTLVSDAFTAAAAPERGSLLVQIDSLGSATLNTDVIAEVSRDNGTTWTAATLAAIRTLADGSTIYGDDQIDISAQPSGTSMRYRVRTLNAVNVGISGVVFEWGENKPA